MFCCFFFVFRSLASLILGLVIFIFFAGYLLIDNVRDKFLSAEFYTENLTENDVYERIYDEVLLDPEFKDKTEELVGKIDVAPDDIADVTRDVISPEYLRAQVEAAIEATINYLNKDAETLDLFIDLGPPLERIKAPDGAVFSYIDRRIDELEVSEVESVEELEEDLEDLLRTLEDGKIPTRIPSVEALVVNYVDETIAGLQTVPVSSEEDLKREVEGIYEELADGRLPTSIPSIEAIPVDERLEAYDRALETVRRQGLVPGKVLEKLETLRPQIEGRLKEADVVGALKVASPALTEPAVEDFMDDVYDRAKRTLEEENFPEAALRGLDARSTEIKVHLRAGDIKEALKVGARGVTGPLIDEAMAELRERDELDTQDRLDLVAIAAKQNNMTREEFLEDVDPLRDAIDLFIIRWGSWAALLIITLASVLMAVVHLPGLGSSMRWPGLTLFLTGLVFLIAGIFVKSQLEGSFEDLLDRGVSGVSPIPDSMLDIISDVLTSMAGDLASGIFAPSIAMIVIGLVLLGGSIVIRLTRVPVVSR